MELYLICLFILIKCGKTVQREKKRIVLGLPIEIEEIAEIDSFRKHILLVERMSRLRPGGDDEVSGGHASQLINSELGSDWSEN